MPKNDGAYSPTGNVAKGQVTLLWEQEKAPKITTRSKSKHHIDWKQSLQKAKGKRIMADSYML